MNNKIKGIIIFLLVTIAGFWFVNRCDNVPQPEPPDETKPILSVSVDIIDFNDDNYSTFKIENVGTANLSWKAISSETWLVLQQKSGTMNPDSSIEVALNVIRESYMKPRIHSAKINIFSDGGNDSIWVTMRIKETPAELPIMLIDPPGLIFEFVESSDVNAKSEQLYISGSNDSAFDWSADVSDNASFWLSIEPGFGLNNNLMEVTVNSESMLTGEYTGYVKFYAENVQNKTANVPVVMKVLPKPPEPEKLWVMKLEVEKEYSQAKNGKWWVSVADSNSFTYLRSKIDCNTINDDYAIEFEFEPPDGIDSVYVFANINVTNDHDGFFIAMNYENQSSHYVCEWFDLYDFVGDGWNRCYVHDWLTNSREPHKFGLKIKENNRKNYLVIYPMRAHAKIDWVAITDRGDLVLDEVEF